MSAYWFSMLVETAARTTVMLSAGAIVAWGLRRQAAATRHLLWSATLATVIGLPAVAFVVPEVAVPIPGVVGRVVESVGAGAAQVTTEPRKDETVAAVAVRGEDTTPSAVQAGQLAGR